MTQVAKPLQAAHSNRKFEFLLVSRCQQKGVSYWDWDTLQETNISHLWKRKIIFKIAISRDMLVPRRVFFCRKMEMCGTLRNWTLNL